MSNYVTIRGFVGTDVRCVVAGSGLPITKFRLGSSDRYFDKKVNAWVDGDTNWYSVSMFRQLATNAGASLQKGDRVIVTGKLRVRSWVNDEGKSGTTVEIDADSAGHDLLFGTASFRRSSADRNDPSLQPGTEDDFPGVDYGTGEIPPSEYGPSTTDVESLTVHPHSDAGADADADASADADAGLVSAPF